MLYLDLPTQADLFSLAMERTPASVSIYLPTTPVSGEISGDRTVLKNLAKEAVSQLQAAGHDKRQVAAIEGYLEDLVDDESFWRFQAHSLAVFVTPDGVRTFRVPNTVSPHAGVADRFFLKPLLRAVSFPHVAYVLALAEGSVRVLEVSPDLPVAGVKLADLPKSAADALGRSSMGVRTESRRSDSAAGQRAQLSEFARAVDRSLRGLLCGQDVPLILFADSALGSIYRTVNSYPHLVSLGINSTPEKVSDHEIASEVRSLIDKLHEEEVAAFRDLYATRASSARAISDVAQTARAATMGAIATLLVDMDASVPGLVEESGAVTFAETETASNYGVVDEIARRALFTGAKVLAVRAEDLPTTAPLAAILRFAV